MLDFWKQLYNTAIIPVIKINDVGSALPLAEALSAAGLPSAEITFRSDAAEDSIRAIAEKYPDFCICAGTVLNVENARHAVNAGAKAIISPGTNLEVVRWCNANDIPVIPGCATPTEIETCMREGLRILKLFPAEILGGIKMLKALSGPYASLRFMPTGGINPSNITQYLSLKNVLACGGTWIVPEDLLDSTQFDKITVLASHAVKLRDQVRPAQF